MRHWGTFIPSAGTDSDVVRVDLPPPARARLKLPDTYGKRFVILADAEEEFDWTRPFRRDEVSTSAIAALPCANRFFTERGCIPTYLVDWPVVANPASAAVVAEMAAIGACDVGTQLHPWVSPPFDEDVTAFNSYAGNLSKSLEHAKIERLTAKIDHETGVRPSVYRAGRYGVGPNTASILATLGYRLDVSVRAAFDYRRQGGPDFSDYPIWPWSLGDRLAELPLTATKTGLLRNKLRFQEYAPARGLLARLGLFDRVPLTPEGVRLHDALLAIHQLLDAGHQLFSLSFHTPTLVPGHTPYVRNDADLRKFWQWWDGVFDLFAKYGVTAIRSNEIADALQPA